MEAAFVFGIQFWRCAILFSQSLLSLSSCLSLLSLSLPVICTASPPLSLTPLLFATQYKILVYLMDGTRVARFSAYEDALGVKRVAWSPAVKFLAVGSYDHKVMSFNFHLVALISHASMQSKVRVLNNLTWKVLTEFQHTPGGIPAGAVSLVAPFFSFCDLMAIHSALLCRPSSEKKKGSPHSNRRF